MMNLASILAKGVTENGRMDGETEKQVVSREKCLFEGDGFMMKSISLQHETRDWVNIK